MGRLYSYFKTFAVAPAAASLGMVAIIVVAVYALPFNLRAQGVMQGFESEIQDIFDRTKDCVVQIKTILPVTDATKGNVVTEVLSIGTGFFVDNKGHILTTAGMLRGNANAVVYWRGKTFEAQSLGQDPRTNLALLKIEMETPCLPLGDPEALKIGSMVLAVGYPLDGPISAEYGLVSNLDADQLPQIFATAHVRSSLRVQPGQSGSPFLNSKGEVVGMVVYAMQDGSSTFALPISAARKVQRDLLEFHTPRHGWTGLTIEVKTTPSSPNGGIAVRNVYQGYPGHLAGVHQGDILVKIGSKTITTASDVMNATFYLSIDETVNFTIQRDGENLVLPVRVVPRPSDKELLALKPVTTQTPSLR